MANNEIRNLLKTAIVLANVTEHSPAAGNNLGTRTDQIDLDGLVAGAACQSDKFDLDIGTNQLAALYTVSAAIEWATAPAAGEVVSFYLGFSHHATAGTGNPGNLTGADAAYAGYSSNLDDSLKQLVRIGQMVATVQATTTIQVANIGAFVALERYACLVVYNESAADNFVADAVEMSVRILPLTPEIE